MDYVAYVSIQSSPAKTKQVHCINFSKNHQVNLQGENMSTYFHLRVCIFSLKM
jgi:hypothetical protein